MPEPYSPLAIKGGLFYLTSVGHRAFAGFFTREGPSMLDVGSGDHVALVVSRLKRADRGWVITKYSDEGRIRLADFTDANAIGLAGEFGILPTGFEGDRDALLDLSRRYGTQLVGVRYNMLSDDEEEAFLDRVP